mmetsp:Transcript_12428/g.24834  ORF Transcript_12428/g.24834 Transcript_12428/m.24834 type:complete len:538 (+) Transcript_12428:97-1710(+)
MSHFRSSSVPRSRRGDIYDDRHDVGNTSSYAYHKNHLSTSTPSSLPLLPQSPILSEIDPLRNAASMEKRRDSLGIFSTRGAPPKNIFAHQGGIGNDYRSTPIDLISFKANTMMQESRNPDDYVGQSSSRAKNYTREHRQEDDYIARVSAEMRAGHRKTQEELLTPRFSSPSPLPQSQPQSQPKPLPQPQSQPQPQPQPQSLSPSHRQDNNTSYDRNEIFRLEKQLSMKESEINELKRNNIEKEIAMKSAHYKHIETELESKTSEIQDLKNQLSSMKTMSEEHLKTKLEQQESKLLKVFKAELEKCKEEMQAEQDDEMEVVQQELTDALDEIKYLKRGCEFVEQEAKTSSAELKQFRRQNEEILAEIAQLRSKNEELSTENELLTERYDDVLHEKIECERVRKELREELEDKAQLEGTVAEMEMEFQHLLEQQEAAKNHLEEAWGENNDLKMRCIQLQKEMEELREDNRLESQLNSKVKEQRDKIGDTVKGQQLEIEKLKDRNDELQREMDELKNELLHTLDVASIYQKTHEIIKNDS